MFNYLLGLLNWNINLQSWGDAGVDEAVDDGRDLLLDDGLSTMRVAQILDREAEPQSRMGLMLFQSTLQNIPLSLGL